MAGRQEHKPSARLLRETDGEEGPQGWCACRCVCVLAVFHLPPVPSLPVLSFFPPVLMPPSSAAAGDTPEVEVGCEGSPPKCLGHSGRWRLSRRHAHGPGAPL